MKPNFMLPMIFGAVVLSLSKGSSALQVEQTGRRMPRPNHHLTHILWDDDPLQASWFDLSRYPAVSRWGISSIFDDIWDFEPGFLRENQECGCSGKASRNVKAFDLSGSTARHSRDPSWDDLKHWEQRQIKDYENGCKRRQREWEEQEERKKEQWLKELRQEKEQKVAEERQRRAVLQQQKTQQEEKEHQQKEKYQQRLHQQQRQTQQQQQHRWKSQGRETEVEDRRRHQQHLRQTQPSGTHRQTPSNKMMSSSSYGVDNYRLEPSELLSLFIGDYSPEDITLTTEGRTVLIRGRQKFGCSGRDGCYIRKFEKDYLLPDRVDSKSLRANIDSEGILRIFGQSVPRPKQQQISQTESPGNDNNKNHNKQHVPHSRGFKHTIAVPRDSITDEAAAGFDDSHIQFRNKPDHNNINTRQVKEELQWGTFEKNDDDDDDDGVTIEVVDY